MGWLTRLTLNDGAPAAPAPEGTDLAGALRESLGRLRADFIDPRTGWVDYARLAASEGFARYADLARRLRDIELLTLRSDAERRAFWLNLYNALAMHGVIALGLRRSVWEAGNFFWRVGYVVGGYRFSLDEIEHGLLRANRRPPYRPLRPFRFGDPRRQFAVGACDPRLHFALTCGARSCPPIRFYRAEDLEDQLRTAAEALVNSPEVRIDAGANRAELSMLFHWYARDFGATRAEVLAFVHRHLRDGPEKAHLGAHLSDITVGYLPYQWELNSA